MGGGYPVPGPDGGTPSQVWMGVPHSADGGYPSKIRMGYPCPRLEGVPHPDLGQGLPQGTPHPRLDGVPPCPRLDECNVQFVNLTSIRMSFLHILISFGVIPFRYSLWIYILRVL